jgi:hydrogenase-4 component B
MHRLGFFITPTPRQADVLLVVGPVTDHLRAALALTAALAVTCFVKVFAMSTFWMFIVLALLLALAYGIIRLWLTRARQLERRPRWDGGVRRLLPEMTYTATGFSNPVRVVFDAIFRPTTVEDTRQTVAEHFRTAIRREKRRVYLVDKVVLQPVKAATLWFANGLAAMHHGRINAYAAYVLLALLAVLMIALL